MSPQTDGAISLGSATNGFNNMYLDGNAYISGDVGIGTTAIGTAALQVAGITALNGNAPATDYALNITGSSGVNGGLVCFDSTVSASTTLVTTTSGGYLNGSTTLNVCYFTPIQPQTDIPQIKLFWSANMWVRCNLRKHAGPTGNYFSCGSGAVHQHGLGCWWRWW